MLVIVLSGLLLATMIVLAIATSKVVELKNDIKVQREVLISHKEIAGLYKQMFESKEQYAEKIYKEYHDFLIEMIEREKNGKFI